MDFEHNAVESDYDEEYDSKVIVMSRGQAHAYNTEEEEVKRNPKNEIRESVMEYKPDENTRRRGPVQLPRMRHEQHREEETIENKAEIVFPTGGWKVQKIEHVGISELTKVVATLSKKESVATPRQRSPGSRNFKWKNITNEILSEFDTPENTKEDFVDVKPKTRSLPKIETYVPTEMFRLLSELLDRKIYLQFPAIVNRDTAQIYGAIPTVGNLKGYLREKRII